MSIPQESGLNLATRSNQCGDHESYNINTYVWALWIKTRRVNERPEIRFRYSIDVVGTIATHVCSGPDRHRNDALVPKI